MSLLRLHFARATFATPRPIFRTFLTTPRLSSDSKPTATATTTILCSLQPQLKIAMRAKDKPRLTTIRSLLAEITNASKTAKPIETDAHLYGLLSRQIKASNTALEEFERARRADLMEKELAQLTVLEELKGRIDVVGEEEIERTVRGVLKQLQEANERSGKSKVDINGGAVMGKAMGSFEKPADADMVKRKVAEIMRQQEHTPEPCVRTR